MRRRVDQRFSVLFAAWCLLSSTTFAQKYVPAFPRVGATKMAEGGHVEMWEVIRDKGKPSPMYDVPMDQLSVTLTEGAVKYTRPDGTWRIEHERVGDVRLDAKGTVIKEEGLNDIPSRVMVFRIKDGPAVKLAPTTEGIPGQFPRLDAVKLFETDRYNIWDQVWLPNRPVTNHLHYNQTAFVFIAAGKLRVKELGKPIGAAFERRIGSIQITSQPVKSGIPHEEEWVEGAPRAIWVEMK